MHDGRSDTYRESLTLLDVGHQRVEVLGYIVARPVENRPLRQISQVTGQFGKLSVEDQSNAGELVTVIETYSFTPPF